MWRCGGVVEMCEMCSVCGDVVDVVEMCRCGDVEMW